MERYLILLLFMLMPMKALANDPFQTAIPVQCGSTEMLLDGIKSRYGEEVIFMAPSKNSEGDDLFHSLWLNPKTFTWTFIVVNKQKGSTCVFASGENFKLFPLQQGTRT